MLDDNGEDDLDLSCWYINQRRVAELVPSFQRFDANGLLAGPAIDRAKHAIVSWLRKTRRPSLGQVLGTGSVEPGLLFTHYGDFYCKGLSRIRRDDAQATMAEMNAKLDAFRPSLKLHVPFASEHLTSTSAWSTLQRRVRLFLLGVVTEASDSRIVAHPYVIASLVLNHFVSESIDHPLYARLMHYGQVHASEVDQFSAMTQTSQPPRDSFKVLRDVSEAQIKQWFAELVYEDAVPNDWGGEKSDLFTARTRLRGKPITTAFLFKGPGHFQPLTVQGLGKRGNQIVRLFSEPADLLVLQHCHHVTPDIRATMRAFANQIEQPRFYCVIDGADTVHLLRAYGKLTSQFGTM